VDRFFVDVFLMVQSHLRRSLDLDATDDPAR
jgi:hypothetical protein